MLLGVLLGLRLRRDLILLGYKDSLSKRNLEEVLRGGDSIVLSEVSLGGVGEAWRVSPQG
ncbi:transposase [Sulfolobus islandicus REY15A]|uniref:Transposase n=1 Tax=Saccharolobus islandicus (strain REY15A) TaxID=930945 RepID=F0NI38_SACI5|nr:transposase [Sulfolobus islandicus REY15A]